MLLFCRVYVSCRGVGCVGATQPRTSRSAGSKDWKLEQWQLVRSNLEDG